MKAIVAFLQNAWSPLYASGTWPRESWLRALHRSRSGVRLKHLTDATKGCVFHFDNTTPLVGETPDSLLEADPDHIRSVLQTQAPDVVVTLGKQADEALQGLFAGPILALPHPAYRVVTNKLFFRAGKLLAGEFSGKIVLSQGRGEVLEHAGR